MVRGLLVLLLWLVLGPVGVRAQDSLAVPSGNVELRRFDAAAIEAYRADYAYDRDLREAPSLWERFQEWLARWFESLFGNRVATFLIDKLLWIIAIVAIVVAVIVLSRGGLRRVFHGAPRSLGEVHAVDEDIRGMDFEAAIRAAEERGDLRRAIRLHYLWVLRRLVDQGLLHWSPEHTDRDYMRQIQDEALRSRFAHVALVFQWVWYGHTEVDATWYAELKRPFIEFERAPVA